jgi:hypothetical protein
MKMETRVRRTAFCFLTFGEPGIMPVIPPLPLVNIIEDYSIRFKIMMKKDVY